MAKKHKSRVNSARQRTDRQRTRTWLWVGLGMAVLVVAVFFLTQPKTAVAAEISPAQAYAKFQQGALFLDVRSAEEFAQIHITNSKLIPLDELNSHLSELPQDKDIVVICLSGKRSKEGMSVLQQAGFKRAFCMTGGIDAWKSAGYPVDGSAP